MGNVRILYIMQSRLLLFIVNGIREIASKLTIKPLNHDRGGDDKEHLQSGADESGDAEEKNAEECDKNQEYAVGAQNQLQLVRKPGQFPDG